MRKPVVDQLRSEPVGAPSESEAEGRPSALGPEQSAGLSDRWLPTLVFAWT